MSLRRHIFRNERAEPTICCCMVDEHRVKRIDGITVPLARTGAQQEPIKENHLNKLSVNFCPYLDKGAAQRHAILVA
ncbi:hypothetical protein Y032_0490g2380 [Ancylostoma ceylanicum]|uniref:Uncharacterized protein n=1 Tax=Ancylostoma ceylanicum TaxID=53326 RepID=A0A016WWD8_9BILA|nr:hypothetical protein Y032_0490g2380 [Ancylostoma ceylanicum]